MLVAQPCLTLCNPMDCSPPGSSVHRLFRQEYWSRLPFPFPGDLPNPGIKPGSPALQADSLLTLPPGKLSNPLCSGMVLPRRHWFFKKSCLVEHSTFCVCLKVSSCCHVPCFSRCSISYKLGGVGLKVCLDWGWIFLETHFIVMLCTSCITIKTCLFKNVKIHIT